MKYKHIWTGAAFCVLAIISAFTSPSMAGSEKKNIIDTIQAKSNGRITINQSKSIADMMERDSVAVNQSDKSSVNDGTEHEKTATRVVHKAGYRIQIYSDNNQRRAKATAERIASQIRQRFPLTAAYIAYKAPYWRLKAGDFLTRKDAATMMAELKKAFPAYAGDMIIVRDRINIIE